VFLRDTITTQHQQSIKLLSGVVPRMHQKQFVAAQISATWA